MPPERPFPARTLVPLLLAALLGAGTACVPRHVRPAASPPAPPQPEPAPQPPPETEPDPRIGELEETNMTLSLSLLEMESRIQDLEQRMEEQKRRYDEAIQEVVRTKAKLRSMESRAEAASQLAETEIAHEALTHRLGGEGSPEMLQIEQMMAMSASEFESENFGGALYLSSQAKELIQDLQRRMDAREEISTESGEIAFTVPLPLRVTRRSNVRSEPGLGAPIVVTIDEASPVVGYSHRGDWIRVKLDDGTQGWIHRSLLATR